MILKIKQKIKDESLDYNLKLNNFNNFIRDCHRDFLTTSPDVTSKIYSIELFNVINPEKYFKWYKFDQSEIKNISVEYLSHDSKMIYFIISIKN